MIYGSVHHVWLKNLHFLPSLFCVVTCDPCWCPFCIEVVFWNVAMAMIFRLWVHSFVTSSAHLMSLGDQGFDGKLGSNWKTLSSSSGHSSPHLHVPSISRYWHIWLGDVSRASLGLQTSNHVINADKAIFIYIYIYYNDGHPVIMVKRIPNTSKCLGQLLDYYLCRYAWTFVYN